MTDKPALTADSLEAWRRSGADRLDPLRFRFIEAMARRSAAQQGEARRLLEDRMRGLLEAYAQTVARASDTAANASLVPRAAPARSAFTDLLEHIAAQTADTGASADTAETAGTKRTAPHGGADLKALRYFRSTWSRLSADRRLHQSQAKVPENAGPLNSQHLVHRAIMLMRDTSPEYLNRLMAYVDGLSWIEQANAMAPAPATARPEGRKAARGKNG